jgi:tetratricopeptide (TPR) repeat protein
MGKGTFPDISQMLPGPGVDERSLAAGPPSETRLAQAAFDIGVRSAQEGESANAAAHFEEAYRHGSSKAAFNRGIVAWESHDRETAITWFRRAADLDHGSACPYLGAILFAQGELEEAEELLRRGADSGHQRGRPVATFFLAILLGDRGELVEAANLYRDAAVVSDFSLGAEAAFRRGAVLQQLGDTAAIDAYRLGVSLGSPHAAAALAVHLGTTGLLEQARDMFRQEMALFQDHDQTSIPIGHHMVVEFDPDEYRLQRDVANGLGKTATLLDGQGRSEEAVELFDEVIDLFGTVANPGVKEAVARALTSKSAVLGRSGDHAGALLLSDEVLARFAESPEPGV